MHDILRKIEAEQLRPTTAFRAGDTVRVHVRIREGDKERTQMFEGVVIALRRGGSRASFTVRKVSNNVGVERTFPLHTPSIVKIDVVAANKVRRAKPFYLRGLRGKAARLKERDSGRLARGGRGAAAPAAAPTPEPEPEPASA